MARKKKEENKIPKPAFDVQIGFVHEFEYINKMYVGRMNGHPIAGNVYRIINAPEGYRLHVGRENNNAGLDGLFLGDALTAVRDDFRFNIELINPTNYLHLPIKKEDYEKINNWLETENKDLWEKIKLEESGDAPVIKNLSDLIKLVQRAEENITKEPIETKQLAPLTPQEDELEERMSSTLSHISDADDRMIYTIADLLDYIASSYNPTTTLKDVHNLTKSIHFLMFELQKRNLGKNV